MGRLRGRVPAFGAQIAVRVGDKFRDRVNKAAKRAGLSQRQFVIQALEKEMAGVESENRIGCAG